MQIILVSSFKELTEKKGVINFLGKCLHFNQLPEICLFWNYLEMEAVLLVNLDFIFIIYNWIQRFVLRTSLSSLQDIYKDKLKWWQVIF